jgi:hypothetical protein
LADPLISLYSGRDPLIGQVVVPVHRHVPTGLAKAGRPAYLLPIHGQKLESGSGVVCVGLVHAVKEAVPGVL